jgi:hypothetical protein
MNFIHLKFLFIFGNFSDEIAYCMEKSYRQISLHEAARILYLNKPDELAEIAKKVNIDFFFLEFIQIKISILAWMEIRIRSIISFC